MTLRKKRISASIVQVIVAIVSLATVTFFAGLQIGMRTIPPPPVVSSEASGTYEWQWAGENWYGRITLSDRNTITQGRVGRIRKRYALDGSARFEMEDEVMRLVNGIYTPKQDRKVEINMLVSKKVTGEHPELEQTIVGTLEQRHCLAGQVQYQDHLTGKRYFGDMILVDYSSHLGEDVKTWCAER
ncbi:MAG: hypothetical protein KAV87_58370 [Desulfobacteraceae bacterium]|nr:hypothetical protein [Desulfobacteraceae bacterium]